MSEAVKNHLFRCWSTGMTPRATMASLRRFHGVALDFETVRGAFIDLSEMFAGRTAA